MSREGRQSPVGSLCGGRGGGAWMRLPRADYSESRCGVGGRLADRHARPQPGLGRASPASGRGPSGCALRPATGPRDASRASRPAAGAGSHTTPGSHAAAPSRACSRASRPRPRTATAHSRARGSSGRDRTRTAATRSRPDARRRLACGASAAREGDATRRRNPAACAAPAAAQRAVSGSRRNSRYPCGARPISGSRGSDCLSIDPKLATGTDRSDRASQAVSRRRHRPIGRRQSRFQHRSQRPPHRGPKCRLIRLRCPR
jgi:hypothetical protein